MKRKKKQNHETGLLTRLMREPSGAFDPLPYLELHGDSSLTVTGYESLLVYDTEQIVFRMKRTTAVDCTLLRIIGKNLLLHVMAEGILCVSGRIDAVFLHPHPTENGGTSCC